MTTVRGSLSYHSASPPNWLMSLSSPNEWAVRHVSTLLKFTVRLIILLFHVTCWPALDLFHSEGTTKKRLRCDSRLFVIRKMCLNQLILLGSTYFGRVFSEPIPNSSFLPSTLLIQSLYWWQFADTVNQKPLSTRTSYLLIIQQNYLHFGTVHTTFELQRNISGEPQMLQLQRTPGNIMQKVMGRSLDFLARIRFTVT